MTPAHPWTARPTGPLDAEDLAATALASASLPSNRPRLADSLPATPRPEGPARMTDPASDPWRPVPALAVPAHDEPLPVLVGVPGHLG
ncbi:hypothetical protein [Demequina mangrovi]|uniref:Uncharacterized protein n=1 Tax=Demequina mangrovi TaxID=1043493 RepID=A0A1H6YVL6_9MICO|nr:hypothetical protein [Demequina mangrovi]SEJ45259.1 hypothetical protein SAMN05421637_1820 [Demequina mangrovi]